ncbi:pyridoxine kinase [Clostridium tetanomorphum]|uniref:pyridoxamine kinase n=1 Tax=Clostridium tetanomorphum TaxID=1553 RepID=UPI0004483B1E|nr:pyridoxamine kinase [Clostridium tetanomorphum]KAJ48800.1 pyridoxamine kinase [Clostridium tetanomorphum DSM 665]KAJ52057.1 pyridoxamine kinase [Clostridium tetanomorphum DSM 665]MBP1862977.1 pyridoxine kinase [Clostridium tetanomorphum]NRS82806.1 pyridoxine kinase [Clostridium tetanomorphum]SQC00073.1 pyridoxamine kinase [Clostridium tetanomorphum]
MIRPVKRVAAIHDLSGFGRASLTAIIPIISSMGIQVCPVPTAILSTHTGGFNDYSFVDLTDSMEDYINHWYKVGIDFDCIYSGFLGSVKQINIVSKFIDLFRKDNTLVVVDPVMGDNGKLYSTMSIDMVENMRKLINKANIITPNFTEAAYLLGEECDENISQSNIKDWLIRLSNMGPDTVIITSVPDFQKDNSANVIAYNKEDNIFWKVSCKHIPAFYPGTGDSFTSVLVGSLLQGDSLPIALDRSVQFITTCIKASYGFKYPNREGVLLEKVLDTLKLPVIVSSYELI